MKKFILSLIVLVFVTTAFKCGGENAKSGSQPPQQNIVDTTPNGARIESVSGVSTELKTIIDAALTEVFLDADAAYGYKNKMSHSDYTVFVTDECVITPIDKVLSFKIDAPDYNGTVYDINPDPNIGEVYAAEQVLTERRQSDWLMVPTTKYVMCNDTSQVGYEAARNGPEHILHYFNDQARYNETVFHGNGGSHPIIPHRAK